MTASIFTPVAWEQMRVAIKEMRVTDPARFQQWLVAALTTPQVKALEAQIKEAERQATVNSDLHDRSSGQPSGRS